jgi:hypothetical protein
MLSCSFDIIALMHLAVAVNGQIYDAEIHPDEISRSYRLALRRLNTHKQKPLAVLALYQVALAVFSVESVGLVLAHDNRDDGSAFDSQQGNTVNSLEIHQPLVIWDAGVFPEARAYGFVPAVGFADLCDATDGHLGRDSEVAENFSFPYFSANFVDEDRRIYAKIPPVAWRDSTSSKPTSCGSHIDPSKHDQSF